MRDAIKYLTVSMNDTRVGWGAFSRDILSHEYFFETSTSQQTLRDIDDILFSPGGSNAISLVMNFFFIQVEAEVLL